MHLLRSNKLFDLPLKMEYRFKLPIQEQPDAHKDRSLALIENH